MALASTARVVVAVLGLDQSLESEQHDRYNLTLPPSQAALYTALRAATAGRGVPLIVVLLHGGALAVEGLTESADALLDAHYPGVTGGGQAVAEALFGATNPSGKLTYTVFREGFAAVSNFTSMSMTEGVGRTYRYYNASAPGAEPVLFPFGFGLSYTEFDLAWDTPGGTVPDLPAVSSLNSSVALPVTVSNSAAGARDGTEVVQVYATATALSPASPAALPARQLVAFERVHVPAASSLQLSIQVPASRLLLTGADGSRSLFNGSYVLTVTRGHGAELQAPLSVLQGM